MGGCDLIGLLWEQSSGGLDLIDAGHVTRQYDSCLPAGQRSMTLLLACVLWSVECGNALR